MGEKSHRECLVAWPFGNPLKDQVDRVAIGNDQ